MTSDDHPVLPAPPLFLRPSQVALRLLVNLERHHLVSEMNTAVAKKERDGGIVLP